MAGYYDLVLGLIPLALAGISGTLTTLGGLQLTTAVSLGSLVAVALVGHAMFVRTPVGASPEGASPAASDAAPQFQSAD